MNLIGFSYGTIHLRRWHFIGVEGSNFFQVCRKTIVKLRLGAQSVTLLNTLRDPTQLRQRQCATRQQQPISHMFLGS